MNRETVIEYIKNLSEQDVQELLREVQGERVDALQLKITDLSGRMAQIAIPQKFEATIDLTVHVQGSLVVEDHSERIVTDALEVSVTRKEGSQATISESLLDEIGRTLTEKIDDDVLNEEDTEIAELEALYSRIQNEATELREEIAELDSVEDELLDETDLSGDCYMCSWDRIMQHALAHHPSSSNGVAASPRR